MRSVSASVNLTVPPLVTTRCNHGNERFQTWCFQDGFHRIGHFVMVTKARLPDWVTNEISTLLVLVDGRLTPKAPIAGRYAKRWYARWYARNRPAGAGLRGRVSVLVSATCALCWPVNKPGLTRHLTAESTPLALVGWHAREAGEGWRATIPPPRMCEPHAIGQLSVTQNLGDGSGATAHK